MHKCIPILLAALSIPQDAFAEGRAVSGVGAMSCGKYLEIRGSGADEVRDTIIQAWLQGFLSGSNIARAAIYGDSAPMTTLPDAAAMQAYTDKHCRDNPLESVLRAALLLDQELVEMRDR